MSNKGHIVCKQCRQVLTLGKVRGSTDPRAMPGFAHPSFGNVQLGQVVMAFLAQHIGHSPVFVSDAVLDEMDDLGGYGLLTEIDASSPWAATHAPVIVGTAKLYAIPLGRKR